MPPSARLVARMPVIGRFLVAPPPKPEPSVRAVSAAVVARLSPLRLLGLKRVEVEPVEPQRRIPLVTPLMRRVRKPLASTARVMQAARDVRTPMTRWERLREAARLAIEDPATGRSWERLMTLGVALAAGRASPLPEPRTRLGRLIQRVREQGAVGSRRSPRLLPAKRNKAGQKKTDSGKIRRRSDLKRR